MLGGAGIKPKDAHDIINIMKNIIFPSSSDTTLEAISSPFRSAEKFLIEDLMNKDSDDEEEQETPYAAAGDDPRLHHRGARVGERHAAARHGAATCSTGEASPGHGRRLDLTLETGAVNQITIAF